MWMLQQNRRKPQNASEDTICGTNSIEFYRRDFIIGFADESIILNVKQPPTTKSKKSKWELPENALWRRRRRWLRRRWAVAEIKIPVTGGCSGGGGLIQRVLISSNHSAVDSDRGLVNRGRVVLDLDLHTTESLAVPPLQHKVWSGWSRLRARSQQRPIICTSASFSMVVIVVVDAAAIIIVIFHSLLFHILHPFCTPVPFQNTFMINSSWGLHLTMVNLISQHWKNRKRKGKKNENRKLRFVLRFGYHSYLQLPRIWGLILQNEIEIEIYIIGSSCFLVGKKTRENAGKRVRQLRHFIFVFLFLVVSQEWKGRRVGGWEFSSTWKRYQSRHRGKN